MYKITTLQQINEINAYAKEFRKAEAYAIAIKHCKKELYAIPFILEILRQYNLPFIDENWLTTNLVEELPLEWTWNFTDRPHRITIPLQLQADAQTAYAKGVVSDLYNLGEIIQTVFTVVADYIITDSTSVVVYLEEIYKQHLEVLELFPEILIENI